MESLEPDAPFSYLAGLDIPIETSVPEGLQERIVPEAQYAVFEHIGSLDTLQQTYQAIYRDWMPSSGYRRAETDDFELYGPRFKYGEPDSVMEIWVPVEKD